MHAAATLPVRFQVRTEIQALVNALRRPTSDRLKLLRMADKALGTLDGSGLAAGDLRSRLAGIQHALASEQPLDRHEAAATLDRSASVIELTARGEGARRVAARV